MGMDLKSSADHSEFQFTGTGWSFSLMLAEKFGWQPEGTRKPKEFGFFKKWHGGYDSNEGQIVRPSDASKLAAALERALQSDSLERKAEEVARDLKHAVEQALGGLPLGYDIDSTIDDEFRSHYMAFIEFCRKGGFAIY